MKITYQRHHMQRELRKALGSFPTKYKFKFNAEIENKVWVAEELAMKNRGLAEYEVVALRDENGFLDWNASVYVHKNPSLEGPGELEIFVLEDEENHITHFVSEELMNDVLSDLDEMDVVLYIDFGGEG